MIPPSLKPVNRHLLILPHREEKKTNAGVLLRDDFKQKEDRYLIATVLDVSTDCAAHFKKLQRNSLTEERQIVVEKAMIEEIEIKNKIYYLVLENYILGMLNKFDMD